ncbi:MAG: sugar phosphate isomerase/epimerase [Ruminococcaceae bacterium]|nr:sugar phosphate isomerase/epimerase [Oscillospiraceae bacterium]
MYKFPIGVMLESFKLPYREAIETAAKIGAKGLQIHARKGEFTPDNITAELKAELKTLLDDNNLVISAMCGDLGKGFGNPELNPELIEKSKRIIDLAKELGTNIVTTHIGVVPSSPEHDRYKIMQEACFELAKYADSMDAKFAVETGPECSTTLKAFLDSLGSKGVSVNLDPANLAMVVGENPVEAVYNLKDYIVHTHAKDGIKLLDRDPEIIYGVSESKMLLDPAFKEVPLGQGSVPFKEYLDALTDIGFKGFLTIEREVGETPKDDIILAADFLRGVMNNG